MQYEYQTYCIAYSAIRTANERLTQFPQVNLSCSPAVTGKYALNVALEALHCGTDRVSYVCGSSKSSVLFIIERLWQSLHEIIIRNHQCWSMCGCWKKYATL